MDLSDYIQELLGNGVPLLHICIGLAVIVSLFAPFCIYFSLKAHPEYNTAYKVLGWLNGIIFTISLDFFIIYGALDPTVSIFIFLSWIALFIIGSVFHLLHKKLTKSKSKPKSPKRSKTSL